MAGRRESPASPFEQPNPGEWFPQAQRATATGMYSIGQYFGLAFLSPVLFWICGRFGWRALFIIVGIERLFRRSGGGPCIANRRRAERIQRSSSTSRRAAASERHGACISNGGTLRFCSSKRQILGASIGQFAEQFHARVLPHVVPDLPRDRAADGLDQGRLLHGAAIHRCVRRRRQRRAVLRPAAASYRLREHRAQGTDHQRPAAGLDDRDRELRDARYRGDRDHIRSLLRPGHVQPRLDAADGRRAETAELFRRDVRQQRPAEVAHALAEERCGHDRDYHGIARHEVRDHDRRGQ